MSSHRRTRAPSNDVVNKRQHLPNWRPTKLSDNKRNKSVAQNAARMARAYAHMHRRHSSSKLNARHFDIELRQPVVRYDHHSIFNIQRRTGSQKLLLSKIIHIVSIGICSLVFSNFPCFRCCITRASERANKLGARARDQQNANLRPPQSSILRRQQNVENLQSKLKHQSLHFRIDPVKMCVKCQWLGPFNYRTFCEGII